MIYVIFARLFSENARAGLGCVRSRQCPQRRCACASEDQLLEQRNTEGKTGPNRAEGDFEDISDLFIRIIFQIEEAQRRLVWFLELAEKLEHIGRFKPVDRLR